MNREPKNTEHVWHRVCNEVFEQQGGKSLCCDCTGHGCVSKSRHRATEGWEEDFDEHFYEGDRNSVHCKKHKFYATPYELKGFIRHLLARTRAGEDGRKHEKTGTFATCDAEGCSETLGLKPYQTGFEMLCNVHGSPCPVDPRCALPRPHSHEL